MRGLEVLTPRGLVRRFASAPFGAPARGLWTLAGQVSRRAPERRGCLGQLGNLQVRLAASEAEIRGAQELRYKVFYEEMAAIPDAQARRLRRDRDAFDALCDHLLVLDGSKPDRPFLRNRPEIVGTCRLLRQEIAERHGGFYTEREFSIAPLIRRHFDLRFLELGRSCVVQQYRTKRTLELLWRGIWAYAQSAKADVMIGCASLPGTDADRLAPPLSFLHHKAGAPQEWRVRAHEHLRVEMNRMPESAIDGRAALRSLPPLVKGYLRLGAFVADGAVVDRQFGTTDVCIVLPVSAIGGRYLEHFGSEGRDRSNNLDGDGPLT